MIRPSTFYDLVSGRRRGVRAGLLRAALGVAEWPYRTAVGWRNRRYDRTGPAVHRAHAPVISIGNLTVGGTGKTPLVKWIARRFCEQGVAVAILSRGYGSENGRPNDEALELARDLPDVPHLQNRDRITAARIAVDEMDAHVLLLDDGFQHRRLHRDLDIVLLDALQPFGYGHLLPRGTLREPCTALKRADAVVLSRADALDRAARDAIRDQVRHLAPRAAWCEMRHAPVSLVNAAGDRRPWQDLVGVRVAAFCGIGNPAGFRGTLTACGFELCGWREYPDHHPYGRGDLDELAAWCHQEGAAAVVCTQKDLVKIGLAQLGSVPLWSLAIETEFLSGRADLCHLLDAAVAAAGAGLTLGPLSPNNVRL